MQQLAPTYTLTDHLCAACLGRVLQEADGPRAYRCSNCGAQADADPAIPHPPICACGAKLGKKDAGIRCVPNPRQRPDLPGEIVAVEGR